MIAHKNQKPASLFVIFNHLSLIIQLPCPDNGGISGLGYCPWFRLNNSSAHSSTALSLVFQLLNQLSWTRFADYYSESTFICIQLGGILTWGMGDVKKFLAFTIIPIMSPPLEFAIRTGRTALPLMGKVTYSQPLAVCRKKIHWLRKMTVIFDNSHLFSNPLLVLYYIKPPPEPDINPQSHAQRVGMRTFFIFQTMGNSYLTFIFSLLIMLSRFQSQMPLHRHMHNALEFGHFSFSRPWEIRKFV